MTEEYNPIAQSNNFIILDQIPTRKASPSSFQSEDQLEKELEPEL